MQLPAEPHQMSAFDFALAQNMNFDPVMPPDIELESGSRLAAARVLGDLNAGHLTTSESLNLASPNFPPKEI